MPALIETLAILGAIGAGLIAFIAIYFAPSLYDTNFMYIWGFIGVIPGLFVGYWVGGFVRAIIRRKFFPATYPNESEQKNRAGLLLVGTGLLFFAGYLPFTSSLSDRWLSVVSFSFIGLFLIIASLAPRDSFVRKVIAWLWPM